MSSRPVSEAKRFHVKRDVLLKAAKAKLSRAQKDYDAARRRHPADLKRYTAGILVDAKALQSVTDAEKVAKAVDRMGGYSRAKEVPRLPSKSDICAWEKRVQFLEASTDETIMMSEAEFSYFAGPECSL